MGTRPQRRRERKPEQRASAAKRGYGRAWQKARESYLAEHPLCVECMRLQIPNAKTQEGRAKCVVDGIDTDGTHGLVVPAVVVDHIVPHRGDQEKFWDVRNWAALCKRHHDMKTARGE